MSKKVKVVKEGSGGGAFYCIGGLGALVYYWQQATVAGSGFEGHLVAVLKSIVWPAFVVHRLMGFLGM